nr:MAG TPA: holin family protein [Caudoviricetes sp.]
MENLLQNIASGLWIVLGVCVFFGLRKWNKRFSELYDELKEEVERWNE